MRPRLCSLIIVFSVFSSSLVLAEEPHEEWLNYFTGAWDYQISPMGEKGVIEYRKVAGGNALVGEYKAASGSTSVEMLGWDSHRKLFMVTGYGDTKGSFWRVEIDKFEDDGYSGKHYGALPNGSDFECDFRLTKVDEDNYTWTMRGRATDGTYLRLTGRWSRR